MLHNWDVRKVAKTQVAKTLGLDQLNLAPPGPKTLGFGSPPNPKLTNLFQASCFGPLARAPSGRARKCGSSAREAWPTLCGPEAGARGEHRAGEHIARAKCSRSTGPRSYFDGKGTVDSNAIWRSYTPHTCSEGDGGQREDGVKLAIDIATGRALTDVLFRR